LQTSYNISPSTLKTRIITAKNLEYYDVDISPRKFKLKVKMPKVIRKSKEALSKEDVIDILNACSDIRLKTYVMCWLELDLELSKLYQYESRICI
jgi:integrase